MAGAMSNGPDIPMAVPRPGGDRLPPMLVPQHNLARYLRVRLEVLDGILRWLAPRTILGIVPIGTKRFELPVAEVAAMRISRVVRPLHLVLGLACVVVPFVLGWRWFAVIPMVILGLWLILIGFGPRLEVLTRAGRRHRVAVCFGHALDAELFIAGVDDIARMKRESPETP